MAVQAFRGFVWENTGAQFLARILGLQGLPIIQADIQSIVCNIFDVTNPTTPTLTASVPTGSIFNTLQTGPLWNIDATGYNWLFFVTHSAFPQTSRDYQCEFTFTPFAAEPFPVVFRVTSVPLF